MKICKNCEFFIENGTNYLCNNPKIIDYCKLKYPYMVQDPISGKNKLPFCNIFNTCGNCSVYKEKGIMD